MSQYILVHNVNLNNNAPGKLQHGHFSCLYGNYKTWQVLQADKRPNNSIMFNAEADTWGRFLKKLIKWHSFLLPSSPHKQTIPPADSFTSLQTKQLAKISPHLGLLPLTHKQIFFIVYFFWGSFKKIHTSRHESTGQASFKKLLLICVTITDIKSEHWLYLKFSTSKA